MGGDVFAIGFANRLQLHHGACACAIGVELLHKNAEVAVAVLALPSDDKCARAAHRGDLGGDVFAIGFANRLQFHRGSCACAIGLELLHKNTVVVVAVYAMPSDDEFARAAHRGNLGVFVIAIGFANRVQLHHGACACAIGVELLHKNAGVAVAVLARPSDHKFTRAAHRRDLGGQVLAIGFANRLQLHRAGGQVQLGGGGQGVISLRRGGGGGGRGIACCVAPSGAHAHAKISPFLTRWRRHDHGEDLADFTFHSAGHQGALAALGHGDVVCCEVFDHLAEGEGVGHRACGCAADLVIGDGQ